MTAVLLDTHAVQWWSAEPDRLSTRASRAIRGAARLVVSAISWYELAWLVRHDRIGIDVPLASWLEGLSGQVETSGITPAIAAIAASIGSDFPNDPADRLIYATAIEHGLPLVTKDERLRRFRYAGVTTIW